MARGGLAAHLTVKEGKVDKTAPRRKFLLAHKRPVKTVVLLLAAGALAAPLLVVGLSPGGFSNASFSALRLCALYSFTLIFMNIVTGAARLPVYMLFNPRRAYIFHLTTGALGFSLAVAHGAIVVVTRHYAGRNAIWLIGPIALGALAVTIFVALDKKRLRRVWRRIHQINYLIFVAIFIKAMVIGSDIVTHDATSYVMKTLMIIYVVIAAGATAYRVWDYERAAARRRLRA